MAIFHGLALGVWGDSTYYMYDAGVIPRDTPITLQNDELVTYEWVVGENLGDYRAPGDGEAAAEALKALETGEVLEISYRRLTL